MSEFETPGRRNDVSPAEQPELPAAVEFVRSRWTHEGQEIDRFFQRFVPAQYELGFCWRCEVIGQGEESRIASFGDQPRHIQEIIARNAEVLLELFEETAPVDLDRMREAGGKLLELNASDLSPNDSCEGEMLVLENDMSRRHHDKWLKQYFADVEEGRRADVDHRGAKPLDELPVVEQQILKVQTWANWRVLGSLSDEEYSLLRACAAARSNSRE